jgi:hypothetical protein
LVAVTLKVYGTPFVRPEIVQLVGSPVAVATGEHVKPLGLAVTV